MSGETLHVHFLGTAGAIPTTMRTLSCIMVRRGADTLLFDCGEGAQQQMMRARTGFTVDAIFITHWHADHFLGVIGLVQTLSFIGRDLPLRIFGPAGVEEFVSEMKRICRNNIRFPIRSGRISDGDQVRFDGYTVTAFAVDHGTPALGYVLCEDDRPGRFNRETAIALGVPPGPLFGRLQRGEEVTVQKNGSPTVIRPDDVMGARRPGRKVVYTGDTRPVGSLPPELVSDADLFVHDATFDESERQKATEFAHSTARDAGISATRYKARKLALFHISSRYTKADAHLSDARQCFSGEIIAPDDLTLVEIGFRDE